MLKKNTEERGTAGEVVAVVVLAIVAVVAAVGLYRLGWWVQKDSTNRQAKIDRQSTGAQVAYSDKVVSLITDIRDLAAKEPTAQITAHRAALVIQACRLQTRITNPYRSPEIAAFAAKECNP